MFNQYVLPFICMRTRNAFKKEKFGKLQFVELLPNPSGDYHYLKCRWKCDCGNEPEARKINVLYGHTRSCGCTHWPRGAKSPKWKGCGEISKQFWLRHCANAKQRNIPLTITIQQAWELFSKQERKCALTDEGLCFPPGGKTNGKRNLGTASLDRADSSKGYTLENVQWVHKDVNILKRSLSMDRLLSLCKKIIDKNSVIK